MPFYIKKNDTSPDLQATLKDASGEAIDLSGAFVRFHMKDLDGNVIISSSMTFEDELNGVVKYSWQAEDTDEAGTYLAEIQVTYADGAVETFPNDTNLTIIIKPELN